MNNKLNTVSTFFSALVILFFFVGMVAAQPGSIPNRFYGSVTINGAAAPDGTLITAKISGVDVAGDTVSGGNYVLDVPDPSFNRDGKTIEFYVSGTKAGEGVFQSSEFTLLNLAITVSAPSSPPSGGSPPVVVSSPEETEDNETVDIVQCVESWECTDWLDCVNGIQKRVCGDVNQCGTEASKPAVLKSCPLTCAAGEQKCDGDDVLVCSQDGNSWAKVATCSEGCSDGVCQGFSGITGFLTTLPGIAGIFAVLFIAGVLVYWKKK